MLIVKELSKKYGNHQVLDKINLSFGKGEVHGLVGENGAGKTTLFKCIAGLES
jgi:ABC-2 type transport system ATP-binding protein